MRNFNQNLGFQTESFLNETDLFCFDGIQKLEDTSMENEELRNLRNSIRNSLLNLRDSNLIFKKLFEIEPVNIKTYPIEDFIVKEDSLYFPLKMIKFSGEFYFLKPIRNEKKMFGIPLEVYYLSRLRYNNIAKCIGYVKLEIKYIILQFFPKTLEQFLSENLSICKRIELIISIAKGLLFLHMKNCVNMNISPWSIFVDENANPYFFDLECLMNVNMECQSSLVYKESEFSAPEALVGKRSFACDIYSLGLLSYYVLAGGPYCEFIGVENLPERLANLIKIMMNSSPNKRPDANYVVEELERILLDRSTNS